MIAIHHPRSLFRQGHVVSSGLKMVSIITDGAKIASGGWQQDD